MYTKINNSLLVVFVVLSLIQMFINPKNITFKTSFLNGWPVLGFFMLSVLASFRTTDLQSFKFLENHWSLLFVPVVMLSDKDFYNQRRRGAFLSLLWGSFLTLLICNSHWLFNILQNGNTIGNPLEWGNAGHNFTEIADTHPAYLGLFVVTSILFLIQDKKFKPVFKYILLTFFLLGLFQLTSNIALLLFIVFIFYVAVSNLKEYRQQLVVLILGVFLCGAIFWVFGGFYMKSKMFSVDAVLDEKRIERWEVSYQIFRENPITGVGFHKIDEVRNEKYVQGDYSLAATKDLNAHNQFLEYLSVNGSIGGFVYVICIGFLFLLSVYRRDHLFTFLIFAFVIANLTESMMVRIKGIEYFSIFISLFLCGNTKSKTLNTFKII